jgi:DNA primase
MEIQDIKNKLTLATVLHHYNLKPDKQLRLKCPFHDDKTPSMQIYYKTHTAYCFSSNCKTHGKSLDVIDFVMFKEECDKHTAIKKAIELLGGETKTTVKTKEKNTDLQRAVFLEKMFSYFKNSIHSSKPAQQ